MSSINKLTLAKNLTARVNGLCSGLETGAAEILNLVSDTTAELLRWWFQQDYMDMRPFNFHEGQKQAILNTLYAHEVLGVGFFLTEFSKPFWIYDEDLMLVESA